ncbi:MAG TPA: PDZ domain-containing protein [Terriglobales bacterium]|nr:PDZ domain-containing protein [Terriglobales bacterium]
MKRFTMATMALLALSATSFADTQTGEQTPAPPARPKVAPRPSAAPSARAFAMAYSSKGSYLGVDISEVTADRVASLKLKEERGVEITMVDRDAPAGKAGLKEHDVILELNGTRIEGEEQLRRMLRETPAGRKITLGISRDGQPMQVEATLAARENTMRGSIPRVFKMENPEIVIPAMPDIQIPQFEVMVRSYSRSTGMMVDNLTPQLGEFFGVKSGQGVLVRSVEKGSAAETAGLKAGDVIVKVDNEEIDDRNDWNRVMRKKGGKVSFGIVRDKREQTLTVTLPEVKSSQEGKFFEFDAGDDFEYLPRASDFEQLEKTMKWLRQLDVDRGVDRRVRVQKTKAEQYQRLEEKMTAVRERLDKSLKQQQDKLQKDQEKIQLKLVKKLRSSELI